MEQRIYLKNQRKFCIEPNLQRKNQYLNPVPTFTNLKRNCPIKNAKEIRDILKTWVREKDIGTLKILGLFKLRKTLKREINQAKSIVRQIERRVLVQVVSTLRTEPQVSVQNLRIQAEPQVSVQIQRSRAESPILVFPAIHMEHIHWKTSNEKGSFTLRKKHWVKGVSWPTFK